MTPTLNAQSPLLSWGHVVSHIEDACQSAPQVGSEVLSLIAQALFDETLTRRNQAGLAIGPCKALSDLSGSYVASQEVNALECMKKNWLALPETTKEWVAIEEKRYGWRKALQLEAERYVARTWKPGDPKPVIKDIVDAVYKHAKDHGIKAGQGDDPSRENIRTHVLGKDVWKRPWDDQ